MHGASLDTFNHQVALALEGQVKVGRVNCDRYKQLCAGQGVGAYPILRLYQGEKSEEVEEREVAPIIARVKAGLRGNSRAEGRHDEL